MTFRSYHTKSDTKISDLHLPARRRVSLSFFIWYLPLGSSYFSLLHFIILRGEISIVKRLKIIDRLRYCIYSFTWITWKSFKVTLHFFQDKGKKLKFLTRTNFRLRGSRSFTFQVVYSVQLDKIVLFAWKSRPVSRFVSNDSFHHLQLAILLIGDQVSLLFSSRLRLQAI